MGLSVRTNSSAINSNRNLKKNSGSIAKSLEKLSSGFKINCAADDASGLAISEKMRFQITSLDVCAENTENGISLCQNADGYLGEVCDMLNRMTELTLKAANGVLEDIDREALQSETEQLKKEIDRIGETANFNGNYLFRGHDITKLDSNGNALQVNNIPFSDFSLASLELGHTPLNNGSHGDYMNLRAIVTNKSSSAYGTNFSLIYGSGSTSRSSLRITYDYNGAPTTEVIEFRSLSPTNYQYDSASNKWSRDFIYTNDKGVDIKLSQSITADDTEKNYKFSYEITNNSAMDVDTEFMFHADTAYNNNDLCEGYFTNGERIDKTTVYAPSGSKLINGSTASGIKNTLPDSISVIDVDNALPFAEKISWESSANKPESISVGRYSRIDDWEYYDNLNSNLDNNAIRIDLGISLYWNKNLSNGQSNVCDFKYGIIALEKDNNLKNVAVKHDVSVIKEHIPYTSFIIETGYEMRDVIPINIMEMNTKALGINKLNIASDPIEKSLSSVREGLNYVLMLRGDIGAYENRLEYTINNLITTSENMSAAKSRIKDTDMAKEMMKYTAANVIEQTAQAMLAQANTKAQSVLQLLQ